MTNKLTAKLSDGREFEVVNDMPTAEGSENRVVWLKPLKPEPPKELWVNIYKASLKFHSFCAYPTLERARQYVDDNYAVTHHYVLADEEKQAREWWEVRRGNSFSLVHSMHSSYEMAILGAGEFDRGEYLIVHVREVLG